MGIFKRYGAINYMVVLSMNHLDCIRIIKGANDAYGEGKTLLRLFDDWYDAWHGNAPRIKGYRLQWPEDDNELKKVCELFGYNVIINHLDYDLGWATETLYLVNGLDGLEDKYKVDVYTFDEFKEALCDFIQDVVDVRGGSDEEHRQDESEWIGSIFEDTLKYLEEED